MSKRDVERRLEDLEEGPKGEYPKPSLAELLSYEWECVDERRNLYRSKDTNQIRHHDPEAFRAVLED